MGENLKILLIDADPMFRKIMEKYANEHKVHLDSFHSFDSINEQSQLNSYQLAVVEYDQEGETGYDVAIKLHELCADLPVLLVSATNRPWQHGDLEINNIKALASKWIGYDKVFDILLKGAKGDFDQESLTQMEEFSPGEEERQKFHSWSEDGKITQIPHHHCYAAY